LADLFCFAFVIGVHFCFVCLGHEVQVVKCPCELVKNSTSIDPKISEEFHQRRSQAKGKYCKVSNLFARRIGCWPGFGVCVCVCVCVFGLALPEQENQRLQKNSKCFEGQVESNPCFGPGWLGGSLFTFGRRRSQKQLRAMTGQA
jgi:hypothetical protein